MGIVIVGSILLWAYGLPILIGLATWLLWRKGQTDGH